MKPDEIICRISAILVIIMRTLRRFESRLFSCESGIVNFFLLHHGGKLYKLVKESAGMWLRAFISLSKSNAGNRADPSDEAMRESAVVSSAPVWSGSRRFKDSSENKRDHSFR